MTFDHAKLKVCFNPNREAVDEILDWLREEKILTKTGFYYSKAAIEIDFDRNQLITISYNDETIGFLTWFDELWITLFNLVEIKLEWRRKGVLKVLVDAAIEYLINLNSRVIRLRCEPRSTKVIWQKLGFVPFSMHKRHTKQEREANEYLLYKILVPTLKPVQHATTDEVLELWNQESNYIKEESPAWRWNLTFKEETRELINPIIHYAYCDWRLRWRYGDKVLRDCRVKNFDNQLLIASGTFMKISVMPPIQF